MGSTSIACRRPCEVELDRRAPASELLVGYSADVEIVTEVRDGVLRAPSAALDAGGRALVLAGGRLQARQVQAGLANPEFTEVRGGLARGDRVVVSLDRSGVKSGARAVEEEAPR